MNGYAQCYPDKPCPPGYARAMMNQEHVLPLNTPTPTPTPGGNCDPSYPRQMYKISPTKIELCRYFLS